MRLPKTRTTQAANAAPGGHNVRRLFMPKWQCSVLRIRLFKD